MSRTIDVDEDIERQREQLRRLDCLQIARMLRPNDTPGEIIAMAARFWRFVETGEVS